MKKPAILFILSLSFGIPKAQQIEINRVNNMPDMPSPYEMKDWKKTTRDYVGFIFDPNSIGENLPLFRTADGSNYPQTKQIMLDTYVGAASHLNQAEAINIMPAIISSLLVDGDNSPVKEYVSYLKNFFNRKNKQNVYLNGVSSTSGGDWWYDIMPNIYFYQLYNLCGHNDLDMRIQFQTVADRWLEAVKILGANPYTWSLPNMNYRAFYLASGKPLTSGVIEPEAAGSIAWILFQAYRTTGKKSYFEGAQLCMEFLCSLKKNPSYEIQLPYGVLTAAIMNAEYGCNYDINKLINWCFDRGELRGWGSIVGHWGNYDVSGLIGEANDNGNDYAFVMNGFQHVAALAPIAKYDKRYAKALGKWILNNANASRLFYVGSMPAQNQEATSYEWSSLYDPNHCIPYESIKQIWQGKSPFAMGDAIQGGWAKTNLSLYSGSSVGYLASVVEKTMQEGILQIDLNRTDFFSDQSIPTFMYCNPYAEAKYIDITLAEGSCDLYDNISEKYVARNQIGKATIRIPAQECMVIRIIPSKDSELYLSDGKLYANDKIVDYNPQYSFSKKLRIKSMTASDTIVECGKSIHLKIYTDNIPVGGSVTYTWSCNGTVIPNKVGCEIDFTAPDTEGIYKIAAKGWVRNENVEDSIRITVLDKIVAAPVMKGITISGKQPFAISDHIDFTPVVEAENSDWEIEYTVTDGTISLNENKGGVWHLPSHEGVYSISSKVWNRFGESSYSVPVLVKSSSTTNFKPLIYLPCNGSTDNKADSLIPVLSNNITFCADNCQKENAAISFEAAKSELYSPNSESLNFDNAVTVSLWFRASRSNGIEQFIFSHGSWEERFKLSLNPDMTLRWTVKTSSDLIDLDFPEKIVKDVFYHITAVYTGYSIEGYMNGKFACYMPLEGTIRKTTKDFTIGCKDKDNRNYDFSGSIDEVRLYDNALSMSQIASDYETYDNDNPLHLEQLYTSDVILSVVDREIKCISPSNVKFEVYNVNGQITPNKQLLPGVYVVRIDGPQCVTKKILVM